MNKYIFPFRIYYNDTDAGGVVYHANYLKFFECARTEWLLSLGFDKQAMQKYDVVFVVRKADIDFLFPARLYDEIEVVSQVIKIGHASLVFEQFIRNALNHSCIYAKAVIKVVCVNHKLKPCAVPEILKEELSSDD